MLKSAPILLLVIVLLSACAAAPVRTPDSPPAARAVPQERIYVVRRGWHIDIGFDAAELRPPLAALQAAFPDARYLLFGFGDRHYLLARNGLARTGQFSSLLAALWPGAGLILVTGLGDTPQQAFTAGDVIVIRTCAADALAAQTFIANSLTASAGTWAPLADGPYAGSRFYASPLRYSGLHTCNGWAARVLRAAGLPVHSRGIEFSGQLWRQLRALCRHQLSCTAV